ncbi:MAG: FAD-dependent thymidylate synthase [Planctomycetota bacterium]|jgi:thymidylate synthase (FAD)
MAEVKRNIYLLSSTPNAGELLEKIAGISYQTQRFDTKVHPKMIKFASGRQVPYSQFKLDAEPILGEPLPGYSKDDEFVAEVIPASWEKVVKFILAIGHHAVLRNMHATFMFENISRKSALHFLRYEFSATNMQSQKYKDQGSFEYVLPEENEVNPGDRQAIINCMDTIQGQYERLRAMGIDSEWSRGVYPNICAQTMTFTTNFEQLRHMCDCLCGDNYVDENQKIMMDILRIMKKVEPVFFHDFKVNDDGSAYRRGMKYSRNKHVNWMLKPADRTKFGLDPKPDQALLQAKGKKKK